MLAWGSYFRQGNTGGPANGSEVTGVGMLDQRSGATYPRKSPVILKSNPSAGARKVLFPKWWWMPGVVCRTLVQQFGGPCRGALETVVTERIPRYFFGSSKSARAEHAIAFPDRQACAVVLHKEPFEGHGASSRRCSLFTTSAYRNHLGLMPRHLDGAPCPRGRSRSHPGWRLSLAATIPSTIDGAT